jgi:PST family polysaccharide transporter
MVHKALLSRKLEFRAIAMLEAGSAWAAGATAVGLALAGAGVFSIAAQFIVELLIAAAAAWFLCDWRPRLIFHLKAIRDMSNFSLNLLGESLLGYWTRNIDNLLVGYYLGAFQLGLYSRAYAVMLFPLSRVTWVFGRVMMRSFAIIKGDRPRVRALFLKMTRVIALITLPMMLGVAATARPFVACVFGSQWDGMVPVLRLLAFVGMVQSVTSVIHSLYLSHDKTALAFRVSLVSQTLRVIGIVAGLRYGIIGVAAGYALACSVSDPLDCYFGIGIIGLSLRDFAVNLKGLLASAATMALVVALVELRLSSYLGAWPRFTLEVALGAALYWGLLHVFHVEGYAEFTALIRERLRAFRAEPARA